MRLRLAPSLALLVVACSSSEAPDTAAEAGADPPSGAASAHGAPSDARPDAAPDAADAGSDAAADADAASSPTRKLWVAFEAAATKRDLHGLFACLFARGKFNAYAKTYPGGYALAWGGDATLPPGVTCGVAYKSTDYACVASRAGFAVADHDVVLLVRRGACGGENDARQDGVVTPSGVRIRGAELGDGTANGYLLCQDRVAVHEAFECAGDWADADCCTGETSADLCPSCPLTCGRYASDGTYGGYFLDCGGGPREFYSQRVSPFVAGKPKGAEFDPNNCKEL